MNRYLPLLGVLAVGLLAGGYLAKQGRGQELWPVVTKRIQFDYDSGWQPWPGKDMVFNHDLGGDPGEYLVYLSGRYHQDSPTHQARYGGNQWGGAFWYECTPESLIVTYWYDTNVPLQWNLIRVRILKNQ
ncbi:MAG: hypothetical protein AB1486_03020 [Planctomycetota bacterium]